MAGVMNNTARQYNVKVADKASKNRRVLVVRLKPGFNVVPDQDWKIAKSDGYVKALKEEGKITDGNTVKSPKEVRDEHRAQIHKKFKSGSKKGGNATDTSSSQQNEGGEGNKGGENTGGEDDEL